ncbi:MAG TPA: lytic transglycosylase domain-containing protein, partial [Trebonia sp.]
QSSSARPDSPTARQGSAPSGSPQVIARQLLDADGQGSQFSCLDALWNRESGWNLSATNPTSGAYGIPQSLPAIKMASAGADWRTDATTQIRWGVSYIDSAYGSPCAAWSHEEAVGWY